MRSEDFRKLVALLEQNTELLHNFFIDGATDPRLSALLSAQDRAYAVNTSKDSKIADMVLPDDERTGGRREEVPDRLPDCGATDALRCDLTCVETCGPGTCTLTCGAAGTCTDSSGIRFAQDVAARLTLERLEGACTYTCGPYTCGPWTCAAGTSFARNAAERFALGRVDMLAGVSCDPTYTCSCTTGTCSGVTCGGSTCMVTCSGDSCGNTCGDSCGWTSNIARGGEIFARPWQYDLWR